MHIVSKMEKSKRTPYFFLETNDRMFLPHIDVTDKSMVTDIYDLELNETKFLEVEVEAEKEGYFIIAVPSTWPPFAAKMYSLIPLLEKVKKTHKILLIYL